MATLSPQSPVAAPATDMSVESGRYGRLLTVRIKPNEDLCTALETACTGHDIGRALLRGLIGSLVGATLQRPDGQYETVSGPGVEILTASGEVVREADGQMHARLQGMVGATDGSLHAGRFAPGGNLAFITIEAALHEWLPD
ncbi:PCC domain-containing protein [Chitinasiproducens palmae]|uniref:Predicted DNA-binding protein with PD1-like DNA-binding motif n=1 Tax=Chitinasiproducens palmae TaxID=1770053 RepID=A0A1H2PTD9_9BURK|nr:DUF296 domain-containing protein [Chitinasiproducens palmae]SDV50363.1 Predicted DNA-binding protein with PD1-like DNA-binding motif [Chitinasiproducens palmae]